MTVVYTHEEIRQGHPTIFLAGPSPRGRRELAWRPDALALLEKSGFTGTVYNPESRDEYQGGTAYSADWEDDAIAASDVILFWVPRNMRNLIGLTTNVEFGLYARDPRSVYGRPDGADHIAYLDHVWAKKTGKGAPCRTLEETLATALCLLPPEAL
jgi:hypothetical protein